MSSIIKINLNHNSYLRDPEQTSLGRKIISESIRLIDQLGFEEFTFKKLATEIGSTEASVYRYFENKHKLLVYLVSWYWSWLDYQVHFRTNNITDPNQCLRIILQILSESHLDNTQTDYIDEAALHRIIIADAPKAYLTKAVDAENQEGYFREYKTLCRHIAEVVLRINPTYPYPNALISTVIEASHQQYFFARHLPSLTNATPGDKKALTAFLEHLVFNAINGYSTPT